MPRLRQHNTPEPILPASHPNLPSLKENKLVTGHRHKVLTPEFRRADDTAKMRTQRTQPVGGHANYQQTYAQKIGLSIVTLVGLIIVGFVLYGFVMGYVNESESGTEATSETSRAEEGDLSRYHVEAGPIDEQSVNQQFVDPELGIIVDVERMTRNIPYEVTTTQGDDDTDDWYENNTCSVAIETLIENTHSERLIVTPRLELVVDGEQVYASPSSFERYLSSRGMDQYHVYASVDPSSTHAAVFTYVLYGGECNQALQLQYSRNAEYTARDLNLPDYELMIDLPS